LQELSYHRGFLYFGTLVDNIRFGKEKVSGFMIKVKSRAGESVQQMVKRFKKMCEKEGLIRDIKRNSYSEKPSERNRRKRRKSSRMARIMSTYNA
jgi:small subunit ribosomal protein S21